MHSTFSIGTRRRGQPNAAGAGRGDRVNIKSQKTILVKRYNNR